MYSQARRAVAVKNGDAMRKTECISRSRNQQSSSPIFCSGVDRLGVHECFFSYLSQEFFSNFVCVRGMYVHSPGVSVSVCVCVCVPTNLSVCLSWIARGSN